MPPSVAIPSRPPVTTTHSKWPDAARRAAVPNALRYFGRKPDPATQADHGVKPRLTSFVLPPPPWEDAKKPIVPVAEAARPVPNAGGPWDLFLSHKQSETGRAVALLEGDLRERKYRAWLDVKMRDCSLPAMMHGVEHSRVFVLVLSESYFESDYCRRELLRALELNKKIVLAHREGLDVGKALGTMDAALKGRSARLDAALDEIKSCTSIQLIVSDSVFAKTTVTKILVAAGIETTHALDIAQDNLRRRVKAIASSLQLDCEDFHMAGLLDRAMETLCIRTEVMDNKPPFHERVDMVEKHLGICR